MPPTTCTAVIETPKSKHLDGGSLLHLGIDQKREKSREIRRAAGVLPADDPVSQSRLEEHEQHQPGQGCEGDQHRDVQQDAH
jgi:hypothetical protein